MVENASPSAEKFDADVVEKKLRCDCQKSVDVVENDKPAAEKNDADVVENAFPVFCERKYEDEVVENASPTEAKFDADVVEKKNPLSNNPSVDVESLLLNDVQSADAR